MPIMNFSGLDRNEDIEEQFAEITKLLNYLLNGMLDVANIRAKSLTADVIKAGSITADEMNVNELSAITANMGKLTSGEIYGAYIATGEGTYPRAEMSSTGKYFGVYKDENNYLTIVPIGSFNHAPGVNIKQGAEVVVLGFGAGVTSSTGLYSSAQFELLMPNGLLMPGNTMWTDWTNIRNLNSGKNLQQDLDTKAIKGTSTSLSGGHNHGIPDGTRLATVNSSGVVTGSVIWSTAANHSHAQT